MTEFRASRADVDVKRLRGFLHDYASSGKRPGRRPAPAAVDEVLATISDPNDSEYVTAIAAAAAQAHRDPHSSQARLLMLQARAAAGRTSHSADPGRLYEAAAAVAATFATESGGDSSEQRRQPARRIENAIARTASILGPISDEHTENLSPIPPLELARDVRESLVGRDVRDAIKGAVREVSVSAELLAALAVTLHGFRDDDGRLPQHPSGQSRATSNHNSGPAPTRQVLASTAELT